jgi:hypothetical protein
MLTNANGGGGLYTRYNLGGMNNAIDPSLYYEGLISGNGSTATPWGLNIVNPPWTWGGDPMTFHAGMYTWRLNSNGNGSEVASMTLVGGNLGIGTSSPGAALEVNGSIKLTSGQGGSITFSDGTVQSTAWSGTLCGGDYAESVDITGDRTQYEPGDVLVIDPAQPGRFLKSNTPYSKLVAGIYSTKPGMIGRRQTTDPKLSTTEVPMAMVGVVPTKVTAENGPIEVGDLIVTSSLQGYAMRGSDDRIKPGTVVGKALEALSTGSGVIEVLVSLQ